MSSVTRFLRQINTADQLVTPAALATLATLVYEFVPTTANYVGNYPPGAMVIGTSAASGINLQISNALALAPNNTAVFILRDMGKTVYAGVASSEANAQTTPPSLAGTNFGWFRQYQLLLLNPITSNNFIGGTSGTTFGVNGTQSGGYTPYLTFYMPSAVAGIWPIASAQTSAFSQAAGGQL
jgi:hypothetical protein